MTTLTWGLAVMAISCAVVSGAFFLTWRSDIEPRVGLLLVAVAQCFIGLGLALVDGPDRDLLPLAKEVELGSLDSDEINRVRGFDWAVRAVGIAIAAFAGALPSPSSVRSRCSTTSEA